MPWHVGGEYLPNLKLELDYTQDQVVPIFRTQFSSLNGFALYYLEFFDGSSDIDWSIEGNEPIAARTWLYLRPDPLLCQSRAYRNRYSFSSTEDELSVEVNYKARDNLFSGLLVFMRGEFVTYHYRL